MKRVALWSFVVAALLLGAVGAGAQGLQTGILQGTARDTGGLVLPGVTVTVSSPALQGTRSTVTDGNGVYVVRGLPPGLYTVAFELAGFMSISQQATVELGKPTEVNANLGVEGIAETVNVTADTVASTITSTTGGQNITYKEVDALPTNRGIFNIASLAPGLTTNTPNAAQVTISGAFAYDNVFLVDGVDINDNLFGTANNLFIEDAVEETQVLTSGISAEYGRFSGGVINAVTKSGGDIFSGSYRLSLTNDAWQTENPYEKSRNITRPDKINSVHEGTFGGPILKSRLWFFGAGRYTKTENVQTLGFTGAQIDALDENKRGEIKLTGTVAQNHTIMGSYLNNSRNVARVAFGAATSVDPNLMEFPEFPNDRWVASYRGVLTPKMFTEIRMSQKTFGFRGSGGSDTNLVSGSPFWTLSEGYQYNAPYFDATDPEDRNNWQLAGNLSYFMTTQGAGSHDLKVGVEVYNSTRTGGNSQTPTGWVFDADFVQTPDGGPVYDANGRLIPIFTPGETYYENWIATRGAELDIKTTSLYVQDRWTAGARWAFDLGLRYERVRSEATGGIVGVDTDTVVPRLAATYDLKGDGKFVLQSTYAHYSGKYSEAQFGGNSNVGNPSVIYATYYGPAGQGLNFAPGFDLSNYVVDGGEFPTANVFFEDGLSAPVTKEFTVSFGSQLGPRAYAKGLFIQRTTGNFVEDYIDLSNGVTHVDEADMDLTNVLYRNSDDPERKYQALQFVGRYTLMDGWSLNGNYTVQLKNAGNFEGEGLNTPGISSMLGDYPELFSAARHYPTGRLNDFQRSKVRLWTIYNVGLSRLGNADVSFLYRYDSPLTFSYAATSVALSATQRALGAAYPDLPTNQTLYFGERGAGEFEPSHLFDLGVNYSVPVFKSLRPYVKMDVFNVLNSDPLITYNTTIRPDSASARDALGLATGYTTGANFGKATAVAHYPRARTFQIAVGLRF